MSIGTVIFYIISSLTFYWYIVSSQKCY